MTFKYITMAVTKKSAQRKNFKAKAKAYVKSTTPGAKKKVVKKLSKSIRKSAQASQGPAKAAPRKEAASNRKMLKGISKYNTGSSKLGRNVIKMKNGKKLVSKVKGTFKGVAKQYGLRTGKNIVTGKKLKAAKSKKK